MSLALRQSDCFWADLLNKTDWYREHANSEVADHFVAAVEKTLQNLTTMPGMGRPRFTKWPEFEGIRSYRVQRPFNRLVIFYRYNSEALFAERLIHGTRDLPRRLRETPYQAE
jgi:plasmid stabilization system protein ParE